jgi:hypothetical protein
VIAPTTTFQVAGLASGTTYAYQVRAITSAGTSALSTPAAIATTFLAGLEAYYKFDDDRAGSIAADSSGFGRNGTLSGGAVLAGDKAPVLDDIAMLSASAPAAVVTVANVPAFNFTGAFSIATWVKLPVAGDAHIVGMRTAGCGTLGWEIGQTAASGLYFAGRNGTLAAGASLAAGAWTHVAVTSDDTTVTIYVKGVAVQSAAFTVGNALKLPLTMGHTGDCAGAAVSLDEMSIYSRPLSAAEVARIGTQPPAPQNLTIASVSSKHQVLSWTAVPGTLKYLVYLGTAPGNETLLTSAGPLDPQTFDYGHLDPGKQYFWRVAAGVVPLVSDPSNEVTATTLAAPDAPVGVTATALSSTRIQVSWGTAARAASYQVFQSTSGGAFVFVTTVTAPTATFRAAGLSPSTSYAYQVKAVDGDLVTSVASAAATATTPAGP